MANFAADITAWSQKVGLTGRTVMFKLAISALSGVIKRSPVKTGRFRASHRLSLNVSDKSFEPERAEPAGPAAFAGATSGELSKGRGTMAAMQWGDTIIISNNLPYARFLENGGSRQNNRQPDGIYGATFAELRAKLQSFIASARALPGSTKGIL